MENTKGLIDPTFFGDRDYPDQRSLVFPGDAGDAFYGPVPFAAEKISGIVAGTMSMIFLLPVYTFLFLYYKTLI